MLNRVESAVLLGLTAFAVVALVIVVNAMDTSSQLEKVCQSKGGVYLEKYGRSILKTGVSYVCVEAKIIEVEL